MNLLHHDHPWYLGDHINRSWDSNWVFASHLLPQHLFFIPDCFQPWAHSTELGAVGSGKVKFTLSGDIGQNHTALPWVWGQQLSFGFPGQIYKWELRVGIWKHLIGEYSRESLVLQGDQTSQSWRKLTLNIHWKDWHWSWSLNTLATWCEQPTH